MSDTICTGDMGSTDGVIDIVYNQEGVQHCCKLHVVWMQVATKFGVRVWSTNLKFKL